MVIKRLSSWTDPVIALHVREKKKVRGENNLTKYGHFTPFAVVFLFLRVVSTTLLRV